MYKWKKQRWIPAFLALLFMGAAGCAETTPPPSSALPPPSQSAQPQETPEQSGDVSQDPAFQNTLTQEEIDRANEALQAEDPSTRKSTPISCFFTSFYDSPEKLNFAEFLRYCPGGIILGNEDAQEFDRLEQLDNFPFVCKEGDKVLDLPVPVRRYDRAEIDKTLNQYAGITTEDLDTSQVCYLEEYNAYYNFTSDWGPGMFQCEGGAQEGNFVRLWSKAVDSDYRVGAQTEGSYRLVLTLKETDGAWRIQSFQYVFV